jgi:NADH-quinone oxidoreductase subunit H
LKEDPTPDGVDKFTYFLAPLMALTLALTSIAILPFGPNPIHIFGRDIFLGIVDLNIGILALFAITALSVYGAALAGWSSNSKYPLLGGLRSSAQMISYELALTMSVVGVLLMAGSFSLRDIINAQAAHPERGILGWNVFPQILGFLCFFTAATAETNRIPFDLAEAESELVAGFHTEYSGFKFAMFFIAQYTSMITISALCSIMFFGGWLSPFPVSWTFAHYLPSAILIPFGFWVIWDGIRYETIFGRIILPGVGAVMALIGALLIVFPFINEFIQGPFWLLGKILFFLFFYVWMRGTLPRFRYDQLMSFGWKLLLPVSLANVVITAVVIMVRGH